MQGPYTIRRKALIVCMLTKLKFSQICKKTVCNYFESAYFPYTRPVAASEDQVVRFKEI